MNMNHLEIKHLLREISSINKKYEGFESITGENYNVFRILKVDTNEVRMHSAFIASLLDPSGTHGQGDQFLKHFLKTCQINYELTDSLNKSIVDVEVSGKNGRIDIVLKLSSGDVLVIENKIYAGDQPQQLVRYKTAYPECHLIYLTLTGSDPNDNSITNLELNTALEKGTDFITISYKDEIINWLIECRKVATNHPILRETITQYINLIKHLTLQNMSTQNKTEIIETVISNPDNIESAQNIFGLWPEIKLTIVGKLKDKIIEVASELNLEVDFDDIQLGKRNSTFWFYKEGWDVCFSFSFAKELERLITGIQLLDGEKDIDDELKNKIKNSLIHLGLGQEYNYGDWIFVSDFDIWEETEWKDLLNEIPEEIKKAVAKMYALLTDVLK